ncbi:hypothetical protein OSCI_1700006 [Kamptonema sp. PCC 6506]|nr:hypothetical protein OSCI_1700006 [Kamptonema sp. PCC 6506]
MLFFGARTLKSSYPNSPTPIFFLQRHNSSARSASKLGDLIVCSESIDRTRSETKNLTIYLFYPSLLMKKIVTKYYNKTNNVNVMPQNTVREVVSKQDSHLNSLPNTSKHKTPSPKRNLACKSR